jgi:hypothetical protein
MADELGSTCGHVFLSEHYGWTYADWSGCINGTWYVPCSSENCYGLCADDGRCDCPGCESNMCCTKEGQE